MLFIYSLIRNNRDIHIPDMPHNYHSCTRLPQRYSGDDSDERPAQTAYVSRDAYTHLGAHHPPNGQRLSSTTVFPEPQKTSIWLPVHINLAMIEASVDTPSRSTTLAMEGCAPVPRPIPYESYLTNVHYSPLSDHPALPSWGANSFEQRNYFVWEDHTELLALEYTPVQGPDSGRLQLRGLGSRENPIVIEDSPSPERVTSPGIPLPDRSPFIRTLFSSNTPTSPAPPAAGEYSPTSFFHISSGYYSDTLTTPATPQHTSNSSTTTLNAPTSPPLPTAFPEFSLIEYSDYPILEIANTPIMPSSPTLLHLRPAPDSPYPNPRTRASSGTTSSRPYGIELSPDINLASPYYQQLPFPPEPALPESGYGAGSEVHTSQGPIYYEYEEEGDERDVNEETKPEEPPETWLAWDEAMVDTGSEQEEEEEVEAQE